MSDAESVNRRIKELEAQLDDSQATSRMYLQNVAHQLTAPLNAIKWSIEALKDPEVPLHRKGNLLSSVYSQATILVHLIKNFSLMSNLEADEHLGQIRNQEQVDPMLLAINLTNDFQPQASDQGKMRINVDDDSFKSILNSRKIMVEKNLIAQALSNLLENAVKYANHGSTIKIRCEQLADGVGVAVTSIGMPISPNDATRIFERGVRGTNAQAKVPAGTGIGLYLAMRVMRLHQGSILLKAAQNVTTFTLAFPKARIA